MLNFKFKTMSKRKKGQAVWIDPNDYFQAVDACKEKGIKTYSRVNVRYLDVNTAVLFTVLTAAVCILISVFN
jgi:hypothetical protein